MEADMDASENARFDGKSDIRTENTPSYPYYAAPVAAPAPAAQ
jgi:hypothetical protein